MSLEKALQENTEAVLALTAIIASAKITMPVAAPETKPAPEAAKKAPPKKTPPPVQEDDLDDMTELEGEEVYPLLPVGERNDVYFAKWVRPALKSAQDSNRDGLVGLITSFGVVKASEIKPSDWDKAVHLAKALVADAAL